MASRRQTRQHSLRKQFIREQSVLAQDTVLSFDISPREILQMNQDGLSEHNMVRTYIYFLVDLSSVLCRVSCVFERQTAFADWATAFFFFLPSNRARAVLTMQLETRSSFCSPYCKRRGGDFQLFRL